MQSLARNDYTAQQVEDVLHSANVQQAFRYELLDSQNKFKRQLDNVLTASVANNALVDIKRTARFTLTEDGNIDFLSDRIKPWTKIKMPDGGFAEFPMGVFLLTTPPRKANSVGIITREVEAYDQTQILLDDKVDDRYTVPAGTNYIAAIKDILDSAGITGQNLTPTDKVLPTDRDWDPGTTKLQIINDLLGAINYGSLYFDENGFAVAQPYVSPAIRASEYTYRDDDQSVMFPDVEQSLDLWNVPNKWVLSVSEADRAPLRSVYTNSNPDSPTSTVGRGRTIMADPIAVDAVDQTTLDAMVARRAYEASQVYEKVSFGTGIMPMHSNADVLTLEFTGLGISAKYAETSWEFELKAGARMKHEIRRVISI